MLLNDLLYTEVYQHDAPNNVITFRLLFRMLEKITTGAPGIPASARIKAYSLNDTAQVVYSGNLIQQNDVTIVPGGQYMIVREGL